MCSLMICILHRNGFKFKQFPIIKFTAVFSKKPPVSQDKLQKSLSPMSIGDLPWANKSMTWQE